MLARLQKEHELLVNKVKFIQGVISEEIQIRRVARKPLVQSLVAFGLKPISKINAIMAQFADIGIGKKKVKSAGEVPEDGAEEENKDEDALPDEDEIEEGQVPAKEYDYLLSMALWALTEERVEQLIRQMNEKKQEHDALAAKHIHTMWSEDLDAFEAELVAVWAKEEEERLRHGGVKNEGKRKGGKGKKGPAAKKGKGETQSTLNIKPKLNAKPENELMGSTTAGKKKGPTKKQRVLAAAEAAEEENKMKPIDPNDLPLRERMRLQFDGNKDMPIQTTLFSGKQGLTAAQQASMQLGPGHKRKSAETDIFKEIRTMQNRVFDDDESDEEMKYDPLAMIDTTQRRKFESPQEEEKAMAAQAAAVKMPTIKRVQRNQRKRKVEFEDEDEESISEDSSAFSPSSGDDFAGDSEYL